MAAIARNFGAKVIKNTGTSLVYYFPKTSKDVIECGVTMMAANKVINIKLKEEGLPSMHYKISADYGRVEVARSLSSPDTDDLFGSTMNVCAKINPMAPANGMVIGSDLYYIAKEFSSSSFFGKGGSNQYYFKKIGVYSINPSFKYQYPVYSVSVRERKETNILDLEKQIPKLQKQSSPPRPPTTAAATIMLIDDEPDILLTYKTYLTSAGYNVDAFTDPREALMRFADAGSNTYNLVLMDIRMPDLNGIQLYYRLKAINPNIKILFVSALDAANEMVSILPCIGLDDVIRKPVAIEQFLSKVKIALE
jgi:CheY-like chemotaxis protein